MVNRSQVKAAIHELRDISPPSAKVCGLLLGLLENLTGDKMAEKADKAELEQLKRDIDVTRRLADKAERNVSGLDLKEWSKVTNQLASIRSRMDRLDNCITDTKKREVVLYGFHKNMLGILSRLAVETLGRVDDKSFERLSKEIDAKRQEETIDESAIQKAIVNHFLDLENIESAKPPKLEDSK